jgi:hypothetical protein
LYLYYIGLSTRRRGENLREHLEATLDHQQGGKQTLGHSRRLEYLQGGPSEGIGHSMEFLEPHQVKLVSFEH